MTVSTMINDYYGINGVCLSMPAVVGAKGVERVLQFKLSDDKK